MPRWTLNAVQRESLGRGHDKINDMLPHLSAKKGQGLLPIYVKAEGSVKVVNGISLDILAVCTKLKSGTFIAN